MSASALWMYGCAHVCEQKNICDAISSKHSWDKHWATDEEGVTLSTIAAFLGSIGLIKYITEAIPTVQLEEQMHCSHYFKERDIYINYSGFMATPLSIAILSQNNEMSDFLWQPTMTTLDCKSNQVRFNFIHLLAFHIQSKDEDNLRKSLDKLIRYNLITPKKLGKVLIKPIVIDSKYFDLKFKKAYNLLDLVVRKNWQKGIKILFSLAVDLIRGGNNEILDYVFSKKKLIIFEKLVEHKLSLTDRYQSASFGENEFHFPLRIAALYEQADKILDFIVEEIGKPCAIQQLEEEIHSNTPAVNDYELNYLRDLRREFIKNISQSSACGDQSSSSSVSSSSSLFFSSGQNQGSTSEKNSSSYSAKFG